MQSYIAGPRYCAALTRKVATWLQELFPSRCLLCETRCEGDWCEACEPLLEREDRLRPARCDRCGLLRPTARPHPTPHPCAHQRPADPKTIDTGDVAQSSARSPATTLRARQTEGLPIDSATTTQRCETANPPWQPYPAWNPHNCPWPDAPWDRIWVGMRYRPPLDGLLLAAKFGGEPHICRALGRWLAHRTDHQPRLLIPIPSTPARLRERGYNPVEQIARGWLEASSSRQRSYLGASQKGQAIGSSMILEHNWLRRSDRKSRQSALGAAARRRATRLEDDVSPEFESPPELEPASPLRSDAGFYLHDAGGGDASAPHRGLREALQGGTMHGRRHRTPETVVTLLDDVMTTGETLAAACRVLRRAGLSRIEVVTLMRRG